MLLPLPGCGLRTDAPARAAERPAPVGAAVSVAASEADGMDAAGAPAPAEKAVPESPAPAAPTGAPQGEALSQPAPAADAPPAEMRQVTVYVTETGGKYHRSGCPYLAKSCIPVDLATARQRCGPCSKCGPPV